MRLVRRTGCSNGRITQGKLYTLISGIRITDDNGNPMCPAIRRHGRDNPNYWVVFSPASDEIIIEYGEQLHAIVEKETEQSSVDSFNPKSFFEWKDARYVAVDLGLGDVAVTGEFIQTKQEGSKMLQIEETTLINGNKESDLSTDNLIAHIEGEQNKLDHLSNMKVDSKAIDAIKEKHKSNISKLVTLIDSREV